MNNKYDKKRRGNNEKRETKGGNRKQGKDRQVSKEASRSGGTGICSSERRGRITLMIHSHASLTKSFIHTHIHPPIHSYIHTHTHTHQ